MNVRRDAASARLRPVRRWPAVAAVLGVLLGSGAGVVGQVFRAPQGTAENLRFEQAAGGVVTITYDLRSDDPNAVFSIVLEVSGPSGAAITPASTSGDIGLGVRPGPGKRIVWAASRDVEDLQVGQFKFNIRASAGAGVPVSPPPAAPAATGRLAVTSTPAGAAVFVDGVPRGTTPVTLTDVSAGAHTVRLVREGFLENQRPVTVMAGAEAAVDVRLTAVPPPPASGGPTVPPAGGSQGQVSGGGSKKWLWIGLAGAGAAGGAVALSGGGGGTPTRTPTTGGGTGGGGGTPPPTPTCTFAVQNLANVTVPAAGQSVTRRVAETNAPCTGGTWTATATQPWITINPSSGTVASDVTIAVAANSGAQRTASLTVAGTTVQVSQDALACTYRANFVGGDGVPANSTNTFVPGDCSGTGCGTRNVDVQASDAACIWTVDGAPSWFAEIERPAPGSRTIRFQVYERNTTGRDRSASFRVAGVNFTVTQCAGRCP